MPLVIEASLTTGAHRPTRADMRNNTVTGLMAGPHSSIDLILTQRLLWEHLRHVEHSFDKLVLLVERPAELAVVTYDN